MTDQELLDRIAVNAKVMGGKPVIKATRLTVEFIIGLLAHGMGIDEIVGEYPNLTADDIHACLLFATRSLESTAFVPMTAETV